MAESSIEVFEITRILVADTPWHFLLEVILRSAFMFIFALFIMRFLGRRAIHQFTSFDLLLIIALGSAMGDPMIYPDVAILWSVFGITSIMVFYRIQNALANRYPWYEDLTEGSPVKIYFTGFSIQRDLRNILPRRMIFSFIKKQRNPKFGRSWGRLSLKGRKPEHVQVLGRNAKTGIAHNLRRSNSGMETSQSRHVSWIFRLSLLL